MAVCVSTPVFEGPFDVLLRLIGEQRVDVYDVCLSQLVDRFVEEIAQQDALDLEAATEFLVIAAVLVELKSKRLLPGPEEVEDDEELASTEERDRLLARLFELQAYTAAADVLAELVERAARSVPRTAGLEEPYHSLAPDLLADVTPDDLAVAYRRAITPRPEPGIDLSHVTVEAVTVFEAVTEICARLTATKRETFRSLTDHCTSRIEVIVRFLALLELCKRGQVALDQGDRFGDLHVSWIGTEDRSPVGALVGGFEEYDG